MSQVLETCEGYAVLAARGKASRWATYRGTRSLGACPTCGAPVGQGVYRAELDGTTGEVRFVCRSHPISVVVPRVTGVEIEGVPPPPPGSWGAQRMADLLARGAA